MNPVLLLARAVMLVAGVVATVLVLGILLVLFEANEDNGLVAAVLDVGEFLAGPFREMFELDEQKNQIALNWGVAAVVYLVVAALVASLLRKVAGAAARNDT